MKRFFFLLIVLCLVMALSSCIQIQIPAAAKTSVPQISAPTQTTATPAQQPSPTAAPPVQTAAPAITAAPTSAPTPTSTATSAPSSVTEKALGYIKKAYINDGTAYIVINYVEMYTGQEAIQKALEDHSDVVYKDENGNYVIDNDYYIRDNNTKLRTFPLSADCPIRVVDMTGSGSIPMVKVSFQKFTNLVKARDYEYLMHINVVNSVVVSMEEQFLP